jgi:phenylacetyl-CoA:acceptor oxidoreductase 26-kDa subunit
MTYGPDPWLQQSWDARAAGNFICGGTGAGLLIFTALSGLRGVPAAALWLAGLGLIGIGLSLVWLEIGRPWRAINVFRNPGTSWMTREAFVATVLMPVGLAAALGVAGLGALAAVLALLFAYCQARMLHAAKGIAAWRQPLTPPLIVLSGLVDGGGLFWLGAAWHGGGHPALGWLFAALLLARALLSRLWVRQLAANWAPRPVRTLDAMTGPLWHWGGMLPLGIAVLALALPLGASAASAAWALAGALAAAAGVWFKFNLVTRAAFNQGFSIARLPVRGARRIG